MVCCNIRLLLYFVYNKRPDSTNRNSQKSKHCNETTYPRDYRAAKPIKTLRSKNRRLQLTAAFRFIPTATQRQIRIEKALERAVEVVGRVAAEGCQVIVVADKDVLSGREKRDGALLGGEFCHDWEIQDMEKDDCGTGTHVDRLRGES